MFEEIVTWIRAHYNLVGTVMFLWKLATHRTLQALPKGTLEKWATKFVLVINAIMLLAAPILMSMSGWWYLYYAAFALLQGLGSHFAKAELVKSKPKESMLKLAQRYNNGRMLSLPADVLTYVLVIASALYFETYGYAVLIAICALSDFELRAEAKAHKMLIERHLSKE